jgi:hypothetical protein
MRFSWNVFAGRAGKYDDFFASGCTDPANVVVGTAQSAVKDRECKAETMHVQDVMTQSGEALVSATSPSCGG